jgi:hypothetical protein
VTTNQVLLGVGLIVVLAVGSQVLASRLKIPALIVLPVAPFTGGEILCDPQLTRHEVGQRYAHGARICTRPADGGFPADAGGNLLFLVRADGRLAPVTRNGAPEPQPGDAMVLLGLAGGGS